MSQADGHHATIFGLSLPCREDWSKTYISIIYIGLLAKLRQYPQYSGLFISEASFLNALELACNDLPDEFNRSLLFKLFEFIYKQLGTQANIPDETLKEVLDHRILRYDFGTGARQLRSRGEAWLVHLIKHESVDHPANLLQQILHSGTIKASRLLNGHRAVCFSGLPLRDIEGRTFGEEAKARAELGLYKYSGFGIAILFDCARHHGFEPVLPCAPSDTDNFPDSARALTQIYFPPFFDYTHEDEWRYSGDLLLSEIPHAIVSPNGKRNGLSIRPTWQNS